MEELEAVENYLLRASGLPKGEKANLWQKAYVVKFNGFCLSIAYITRRRHPYIESLSD